VSIDVSSMCEGLLCQRMHLSRSHVFVSEWGSMQKKWQRCRRRLQLYFPHCVCACAGRPACRRNGRGPGGGCSKGTGSNHSAGGPWRLRLGLDNHTLHSGGLTHTHTVCMIGVWLEVWLER